VYQQSAIQIEWTDERSAEAPNRKKCLVLTVVLTSEPEAGTMRRRDPAIGFAFGSNGRGARRAYVFVDRAERQARTVSRIRSLNKDFIYSLILGHVIAHEAGHLLLPPDSHSPIGIMRAGMDVNSGDDALRGQLLFQSQQSKLMQAAVMAETG